MKKQHCIFGKEISVGIGDGIKNVVEYKEEIKEDPKPILAELKKMISLKTESTPETTIIDIFVYGYLSPEADLRLTLSY